MLFQVFGQIFRHALGEGRHQHALVDSRTGADLREQIVNLRRHRSHLDDRIKQTGRTHNLIHYVAARFFELVVARRGRNVDGLRCQRLELFKFHWAVVQRGRQAEAILHQRLFTRPVTAIHAADLRNGYVGFIHHQQAIRRQVVKQGWRRLARPAPGEVTGVVFDAGAVAQLVHHLQIKLGALAQALLFQQFIVGQQHLTAIAQLDFNLFHRLYDTLAWGHVVGLWIDGVTLDHRLHMAGKRVEQRQPLHLFIKQFYAQGDIVGLGGEDINHLAAHAERTALEGLIVAGVLQLGQTAQNGALIDNHAHRQVQHHFQVEIRVAQTVNRRYRGHHHHIATLKQRFGGRESHLLNMFVYRGIFLDKGVRTWDIGFRLIVVVVRDEILNGVFRKELFHLAVQLRRQGFIGRQHHGRTLQVGNDVGNGKGFTRAGYPQQRLMRETILQPLFQTANRFWLIARRTESGIQFERFTH